MNWQTTLAKKQTPSDPKQQLIAAQVDLEKLSQATADILESDNAIIIDMEYKKPEATGTGQNPNLPDHPFGKLYHENAKLWIHKDLADILLLAANMLMEKKGWKLKVMDSLRPMEAQAAMKATKVANQWPDEWVSDVGQGAHPRGMAVDIVPVDAKTGAPIDMGTAFDSFSPASARNYEQLSEEQKANRSSLTEAMMDAAKHYGKGDQLLALPSEWWDFRFKPEVYEQYPPLSNNDLPPHMKITTQPLEQQKNWAQGR